MWLSIRCARLVARPEDCQRTGSGPARAHLEGKYDGLVSVAPIFGRVKGFAALIADRANDAGFAALKSAELTGIGTAEFVSGLENVLRRRIALRAPGRKLKHEAEDRQSPFSNGQVNAGPVI